MDWTMKTLLLTMLACWTEARVLMRSAPLRCPIDNGNLIDVKLYVKDQQDCFKWCEVTDGCKFFRYAYMLVILALSSQAKSTA